MRHCCEVLEDQTDVSQKHWIEIKVIFLIKGVIYDVYYNSLKLKVQYKLIQTAGKKIRPSSSHNACYILSCVFIIQS